MIKDYLYRLLPIIGYVIFLIIPFYVFEEVTPLKYGLFLLLIAIVGSSFIGFTEYFNEQDYE